MAGQDLLHLAAEGYHLTPEEKDQLNVFLDEFEKRVRFKMMILPHQHRHLSEIGGIEMSHFEISPVGRHER